MVAEEGEHPEINESGSYQTVSIELDIIGLATNTILEANKINELEGGANLLTMGMNASVSVQEEANKSLATKLRSLDETFACINIFKVLKSLIAQW